MKRIPRWAWILAALVAALGLGTGAAWYGWRLLTVRPAVRALPRGATDLHEHYTDSGFPLHDYTYRMKARMPQSEFAAYASRLGLHALAPHESAPEWIAGDPAWWDPTPQREGTCVNLPDEQSGVMAKWENGWVYVMAWSS